MPSVHLLLGSNLGDKRELLLQARSLISERVGAIVCSTDEMSTEPWGYASENDYLNQIVVVETEFAPMALLDRTQEVERMMGRRQRASRDESYSDRPIDIDILYYDDLRIDTPRLTIPHPEIKNREFVQKLLSQLPPRR